MQTSIRPRAMKAAREQTPFGVRHRGVRHVIRSQQFRKALFAAALIGCTATQLFAQVIDTRTGQSKYGATIPSYGQTFTVPAGAAFLNQFSFFLQPNTADVGGTVSYSAFLMAWNGTRPTGPLLYNSGPLVTPGCCTIAQTVFNTGALNVTAGAMYIAFLTPADGSSLVAGYASAAGDYTDSYAAGYYAFNPNCPATPGSCDWARSASVPNLDMDFTATFSSTGVPNTVVPEPSTLILFASGLAGVALYASRKNLRRTV